MKQCEAVIEGIQCEHEATNTLVGYDHDLERVSPGRLHHKGYVEGSRTFVCKEHVDGVYSFLMMRHYKVRILEGIVEKDDGEK